MLDYNIFCTVFYLYFLCVWLTLHNIVSVWVFSWRWKELSVVYLHFSIREWNWVLFLWAILVSFKINCLLIPSFLPDIVSSMFPISLFYRSLFCFLERVLFCISGCSWTDRVAQAGLMTPGASGVLGDRQAPPHLVLSQLLKKMMNLQKGWKYSTKSWFSQAILRQATVLVHTIPEHFCVFSVRISSHIITL